jgi:hypothetical protein
MSSSEEEALSFTAGADDPMDFVNKVMKLTANKRSQGQPGIEFCGELARRMAEEAEYQEVIGWKQTKTMNGLNLEVRAPERPGEPPIAVAGVEQIAAVFAERFPMTGAVDRAGADLENCKQSSLIRKHNSAFNKHLARTGRCLNTPAARTLVIDRQVRKQYVDSTCAKIHPSIDKHVASIRSHLLIHLHDLLNLEALQVEAVNYEEHTLIPIAMDCGVTSYWKLIKDKPKKKASKKKKKTIKSKKKTTKSSSDSSSETDSDEPGDTVHNIETQMASDARMVKIEETIVLLSQAEQRMDTRLKEHKKELEEDMMAPMKSKMDRMEGLMADMLTP